MASTRPPKSLESLFAPLASGGRLTGHVVAERRRRLVVAMTEAVSRFGYPDTSLESVIRLAGVSKTDFYGVFGSKAECFWAAFEVALEGFAGDVEALVSAQQGPRRQLEATIEALAQKIEEDPGAVGLVLVDSLALGASSEDPRTRSQLRFESLLRTAVEHGGGQTSEATARGVIIGLRRLSYRALRDHSGAALSAAAPTLAGWIMEHAARPPSERALWLEPDASAVENRGPNIPWEESPRSFDSRVELSHRERIVRAVAQLVAADGYGKLSVPRVSAHAGISNQTFYAEFEDKEDALSASFDALIGPSLTAVEAAYGRGSGWKEKVAAGLAGLLDSFVAQPLLTEVAFRALPLSGRAGLDRIDAAMDRLGSILADRVAPRPSEMSGLISAATIGGAWGMIRTEALAGRGSDLAVLHPELVGFVVAGLARR